MSKKKLKLAIIDNVGEKAGMDEYNNGLLNSLNLIGYEVIIISNYSKNSEYYKKIFTTKNNKLYNFIVFFIAGIFCIVKNINIVILHYFDLTIFNLFIIVFYKLIGIKIIGIIHDVESLTKKQYLIINKIIFKFSNILLVHNDYSRKEYLKLKINKEVFIIPHGCKIENINKIDKIHAKKILGINRKIILFFGQIKKIKRLDLLLEAQKFIRKDIAIIVAGRFKDDYTKEEIVKIKIDNNNIIWLNRYITNIEKRNLFLAADICVLPYDKIYASGVLYTACKYRLPVICSDIDVFKEIIIDNENGFLFEKGNAKDLANKINMVIYNDELLLKCSNKLSDYINQNNAWLYIAEKINTIIKNNLD